MSSISLAVVAALSDEIKLLRSRLNADATVHRGSALFLRGEIDNHPLLLARSGLGREAMRRAIAYLIEQYRPKCVLHIGYCGGADPGLGVGDLLVAETVVDAGSAERFCADAALVTRAERICGDAKLRARRGTLVTSADVIPAPHEKAFIGTQHEAHAVDMESADLARACGDAGIPWCVVRAVLDPLSEALPEMEGAVTASGETDGPALAAHLMWNPRDLMKLPRMGYLANRARGALTDFVLAWLAGGEG